MQEDLLWYLVWGSPFPRLHWSPIKQETNLYVYKHRFFCVFVISLFGP